MIWTVLGTLGITLATIVVGLLADRRWSLIPRKDTLLEAGKAMAQLAGQVPGGAAATAISGSPGDIEMMRRKQRCPNCRTEMKSIADDHVAHDEGLLLVLRFSCARCTTQRSIYVNPR